LKIHFQEFVIYFLCFGLKLLLWYFMMKNKTIINSKGQSLWSVYSTLR